MEPLTPEEKQAFIDLYKPSNAKNLTQEQLAAMATFTKEQIGWLAKAYPNNLNAYLILKDKNKEAKGQKQTYPLATWENLLGLHRQGQTQFVAHSFRSIFNIKNETLKVAATQDLTKDQVKNELKTGQQQTGSQTQNPEGSGLAKSAEQIALEEKAGLEGGNEGGNEGGAKVINIEGLDKMNKLDLSAKYLEVFGEEPVETLTKKELIKLITDKANS